MRCATKNPLLAPRVLHLFCQDDDFVLARCLTPILALEYPRWFNGESVECLYLYVNLLGRTPETTRTLLASIVNLTPLSFGSDWRIAAE